MKTEQIEGRDLGQESPRYREGSGAGAMTRVRGHWSGNQAKMRAGSGVTERGERQKSGAVRAQRGLRARSQGVPGQRLEGTHRPSAVMRISATSAGVPTKAPAAPATIPSAALSRKGGGVPSSRVSRSSSTV